MRSGRAQWSLLLLSPGLATLLVAVVNPAPGSPVVLWCAQYWWTVMICGGLLYLVLQVYLLFAGRAR